MNIDPSVMNANTTAGQIALILFALTSLLGAVKPLFSTFNIRKIKTSRKLSGVQEDLNLARKEIRFRTEEAKSLREWQLAARQLIYLMRSSMADSGIEVTDKMSELMRVLEEYEMRSIIIEEGGEEEQ